MGQSRVPGQMIQCFSLFVKLETLRNEAVSSGCFCLWYCLTRNAMGSQVQWYISIIPAFGMLRRGVLCFRLAWAT